MAPAWRNFKNIFFTVCNWPNRHVGAKILSGFQFEGKTDVWISQVRSVKKIKASQGAFRAALCIPEFSTQVWFLLCCFWNFRLRNAVSPAIVWRRRYRIEFFIWLKLRFCKDASKFLKNHHFKFVPCSPVKSTVEILQIFLENMNFITSNLPQIY